MEISAVGKNKVIVFCLNILYYLVFSIMLFENGLHIYFKKSLLIWQKKVKTSKKGKKK